MKAIPKPLLIVIIVIVILGVLSCSAGVIRGLDEEEKPPPSAAASDAKKILEPGPVPSKDVRRTGGDCEIKDEDGDGSDDDITITESCDLTIEGQVLLPRVLRLSVASISLFGQVSVQQEIDGKLQPEPPESAEPENGFVEISASGVGPVKIRILCGTCLLRISG